MSGGRPNANPDLLNLLGMTLSNPDPNVPRSITLGPSNELSAPRVLYLYRQNANIINPPRHMLGDTYRFNNELYTIIRGAQVPSVGEYVYQFMNADGYTVAQTESAILAGKALKLIFDKKLSVNDGIPQNNKLAKYWEPISDEKLKILIDLVNKGKYKYQKL